MGLNYLSSLTKGKLIAQFRRLNMDELNMDCQDVEKFYPHCGNERMKKSSHSNKVNIKKIILNHYVAMPKDVVDRMSIAIRQEIVSQFMDMNLPSSGYVSPAWIIKELFE